MHRPIYLLKILLQSPGQVFVANRRLIDCIVKVVQGEGRGGVLQSCLQDQAEELNQLTTGLFLEGADEVWVETKLDSQSVRIVCSIAQYRHQCWEVRHSQLPGHGRGGKLWGGVRVRGRTRWNGGSGRVSGRVSQGRLGLCTIIVTISGLASTIIPPGTKSKTCQIHTTSYIQWNLVWPVLPIFDPRYRAEILASEVYAYNVHCTLLWTRPRSLHVAGCTFPLPQLPGSLVHGRPHIHRAASCYGTAPPTYCYDVTDSRCMTYKAPSREDVGMGLCMFNFLLYAILALLA